MDLQQYWQDLNEKKFSHHSLKKEDIMQAIQKDSQSMISELKKRLKIKLYWIVFFIAAFSIWMLFALNQPELLMLIGGFNLLYVLGLILIGRQYRQMTTEVSYDRSTLQLMKDNATLIKKALRIETISGLFLMPIAIVGGVLISRLYQGFSIAETFSNSQLLLVTLALLVVLVPLMTWLSDKMNQFAYGSYIQQLDANIAKMEEFV